MKHIVSINELNSLELKREVLSFCEDHLVELLEGDFKITAHYEKSDTHGKWMTTKIFGGDLLAIRFFIKLENRQNAKSYFSWDDVCDKYIPVFEILNRKYNIVKLKTIITSNDHKWYTKNLLNVVKSDLGNIREIIFYIKEDKKSMKHFENF